MLGEAEAWLSVLWLLTFVSLFVIERPTEGGKPRRIELAVLGVFFLFFSILAMIGRPILSTAITLVVIILIGAASRVKYAHTLDNLSINDIRFAVRQGGLSYIARTYGELKKKASVVVLASICFVLVVAVVSPDSAFPSATALALLLVVAALVAVAVHIRGVEKTRHIFFLANERGHFLGFMGSVVLSLLARWRKPKMLGVAADRPANLPPRSSNGRRPHIVMIHHESTFDPKIYDLPTTPLVEDFLHPRNGISGRLKVDIFGGTSWMTEFAIQTGLSANCFGNDARFIFHVGEGRFGHALPAYLLGIGYQTVLATTMNRGFMNYSRFYQSIGMQHTLFADDYSPRLRTPDLLLAHSDEALYGAVLDWLRNHRDAEKQLFLTLSTNLNHGPHTQAALSEKLDPDARSFATSSLNDKAYGEYFARLDFSARSYKAFKTDISSLLEDEPILFVRYGDHQPHFVSSVPAFSDRADFRFRRYETFYALEGVGIDVDPAAGAGCEVLDAAFLGTLALKAANVQMGPLHELHFDLIPECGAGYFDSQSTAKAQYHRLLFEQGLIHAGF